MNSSGPITKWVVPSVVIENKTRAGGTLAAAGVARGTPDGYTFLIHHNGMATAPGLYRKLAYNPLSDFEYVGQIIEVATTLLGRKDLPANTAAEFFAWVKAQGNKANLARTGLGAVLQLCGMLFQLAVGMEMGTIPLPGHGASC